MTKEDIICMARKAGLCDEEGYSHSGNMPDIECFANLIAAAEREACAQVCDDIDEEFAERGRATWCSAAIRARGQE